VRPLSALMCVYNDSVFTKACLEGIQPCVDQIVIVEGSWNGLRGTYDYGENRSSDDGTRRIVEQFQALYPDKVVLVDSMGDEECSRNLGLNLCKHDWVLHLDSDEFYWPHQIMGLKAELPALEAQGFDRLSIIQYTFYFNFRLCMKGRRIRLFNAGLGIAYTSGNNVGDVLVGGVSKTGEVEIENCHFQWVGDRHKVLATPNINREDRYQREVLNEDPEKITHIGSWKWWLHHIYLQFDGTNLAELEHKNMGSIHPFSYFYEDCRRDPLVEWPNPNQFPEAVKQAPWFNFETKGLVSLEPDLA